MSQLFSLPSFLSFLLCSCFWPSKHMYARSCGIFLQVTIAVILSLCDLFCIISISLNSLIFFPSILSHLLFILHSIFLFSGCALQHARCQFHQGLQWKPGILTTEHQGITIVFPQFFAPPLSLYPSSLAPSSPYYATWILVTLASCTLSCVSKWTNHSALLLFPFWKAKCPRSYFWFS